MKEAIAISLKLTTLLKQEPVQVYPGQNVQE